MAHSNVLGTLQHVTNVKLGKVAHRQRAFEERKAALLAEAAEQSNPAAQTLVLAEDALERKIPEAALGIHPETLKRYLQQAAFDPSISQSQIAQWDHRLRHALDCQSHRHQLTSLFGQLVTEYLNNPNSADGTSAPASEADYEQIGREEMHQQRTQWEEYAFTSRLTDTATIKAYLENLFDTKNTKKRHGATPLQCLREAMREFVVPRMSSSSVQLCIKALLKADLFAGDKRKALVSMQPMSSLCSEVSDCLNSDLELIDEWQWDHTPILLHQRRQLNGKYRVYMDEEIYQAILIQYIGLHWAAHFKDSFLDFQDSDVWLHATRKSMTKEDRERRQYFLDDDKTMTDSLRGRQDMYFRNTYFCTQLPETAEAFNAGYGEEEDSDDNDSGTSLADIKQTILRHVATESIINMKLHGDFTVLQSDFKWFGPSLPHSTIFAVLEFLEVPVKWQNFFRKFLTVPLAFVQDGEQGATHQRKSGIPMSHILADAMGEAVLFPLNFAINQRTGGADLIRFYDDMWIFGSSEHCEKGWAALNEFTKVMGLELNLDKTGTVQTFDVSKVKPVKSSVLPKGKVSWGFLRLSESGNWQIDQSEVDKHIVELRRQLAACRSIMAFISAYNAYVNQFMLRNFGKPARCLGQAHIEDAIKTIARVNKEIFTDTNGDAAEYLRRIIASRFGIKDHLPDGFFYFAQDIGGLALQNPLLTLQLQWEMATSMDNPNKMLDDSLEEEAVLWSRAKATFETQKNGRGFGKRPASVAEDEGFMSLEEYMRYPELRSKFVARSFDNMMKELGLRTVMLSADFVQLSKEIASFTSNSASKSALQLYGPGVLDYCGNVRLGESEMLPAGLLEMLQSERFRWQG